MKITMIIRELLIMFSFIFTLSTLFALLTGAHLTNSSIASIGIFSLILSIGCWIFYIDRIVDFLGVGIVQFIYILFVFLTFVCSNYIFAWRVPILIMGVAFVVMIISFFIGKWILFSISMKLTQQMNKRLKKKFHSK